MTTSDLIRKLESQGIILAIQNGQIVCLTKPSLLTPELKTEISGLKSELLVYLKANPQNLKLLRKLYEQYCLEIFKQSPGPQLRDRFEIPMRKLWGTLTVQEKQEFLGPDIVFKHSKPPMPVDASQPITCHSKFLDENFVIYPKERRIQFQSGVAYSEREFEELRKLSPEEIKFMHQTKKSLSGEIVLVQTPSQFNDFQNQVKNLIKTKTPKQGR